MSGYSLYILVEADTKPEAKKAAGSIIDDFWENGTLVEGDRGEVSGDEIVCLSECGKEKLTELNKERAAQAKGYLLHALEEANKHGYVSLLDVPPSEVKDTLVGFYLKKAGDVLDGSFAPWGVVYDSTTYECGFREERVKELMEHPEKWWLVDCTVGP